MTRPIIDVDAIVDAVESNPQLRARLARALVPDVLALLTGAIAKTTAPTVYSTRKGCAPPEYREREKRWRRDCPLIPGCRKIGRWWTVSVADFDRWMHGDRPSVAPANDMEPWSPRRALERAGLRGVRS